MGWHLSELPTIQHSNARQVRLRIGIPALQRRESEESQEEFGGRVEKRNSFHSIARLFPFRRYACRRHCCIVFYELKLTVSISNCRNLLWTGHDLESNAVGRLPCGQSPQRVIADIIGGERSTLG